MRYRRKPQIVTAKQVCDVDPPDLVLLKGKVNDTDWLVRFDDGRIAVFPDEVFQVEFEPVTGEHSLAVRNH